MSEAISDGEARARGERVKASRQMIKHIGYYNLLMYGGCFCEGIYVQGGFAIGWHIRFLMGATLQLELRAWLRVKWGVHIWIPEEQEITLVCMAVSLVNPYVWIRSLRIVGIHIILIGIHRIPNKPGRIHMK